MQVFRQIRSIIAASLAAKVMTKSLAIIRRFLAFLVVLLVLVTWSASTDAQQLTLGVREATLARTIDGHQALEIHLNERSKADYADFTARYVGRRIEFSVQGHPLMSARSVTTVLSGKVQVLVDQKSVADQLAASLAAGRATIDVRVLGE
jgi:hypothetical protein